MDHSDQLIEIMEHFDQLIEEEELQWEKDKEEARELQEQISARKCRLREFPITGIFSLFSIQTIRDTLGKLENRHVRNREAIVMLQLFEATSDYVSCLENSRPRKKLIRALRLIRRMQGRDQGTRSNDSPISNAQLAREALMNLNITTVYEAECDVQAEAMGAGMLILQMAVRLMSPDFDYGQLKRQNLESGREKTERKTKIERQRTAKTFDLIRNQFKHVSDDDIMKKTGERLTELGHNRCKKTVKRHLKEVRKISE